jgi:hypothetical protein
MPRLPDETPEHFVSIGACLSANQPVERRTIIALLSRHIQGEVVCVEHATCIPYGLLPRPVQTHELYRQAACVPGEALRHTWRLYAQLKDADAFWTLFGALACAGYCILPEIGFFECQFDDAELQKALTVPEDLTPALVEQHYRPDMTARLRAWRFTLPTQWISNAGQPYKKAGAPVMHAVTEAMRDLEITPGAALAAAFDIRFNV